MATLKIAVLSTEDARNPRTWSGTPHHISESLVRGGMEVSHLGPLPAWPRRLLRLRKKLEARLGLPQCLPEVSVPYARLCSRVAAARIAQLPERPDVLFAPASSPLVASLGTDIPLVYLSDATVRLMLGYYPEFTGLSERTIRLAEDFERRAIARADLVVYPTRWAATSAVEDYGAEPGKILIAPLGANIEDTGPAEPPADDVCRLLFVGTDWKRKGGDIALNVLRELEGQGVPARLTVVGSTPPGGVDAPGAEFVGYLDKNRPEDRERLAALYRQAHFFLLPTRNECYGIVFCEAVAYGLPSLATRTGGVPDVIAEGESGFTFPPEDDGRGYAARIVELWADRDRYRALRASSRRVYEERLNWDAWSAAVIGRMERLVGKGEAREG